MSFKLTNSQSSKTHHHPSAASLIPNSRIDFQVSSESQSNLKAKDQSKSIIPTTTTTSNELHSSSSILRPSSSDLENKKTTTTTYHPNDLLNTEIPNSSLNISTSILDLTLPHHHHHSPDFRLSSFLDDHSSIRSSSSSPSSDHHHEEDEDEDEVSNSRRSSSSSSNSNSNSNSEEEEEESSLENQSSLRSILSRTVSNSSDQIEWISHHPSSSSTISSHQTSFTQSIDERFERRRRRRKVKSLRRCSMIENDFKAFSSFPNPSPQLDSNLVNLTSNSINSSSSENIHDRIKREKRRSSKPIMKTLSVSTPHSIGSSSPPFLNQRKMSFNRPIGLRTMSSAHELGRRSLDENELNFEVWLKEINKRFRRSDELLKEISIGLNRSTHDLMSNQTERIEFEKDLVGFKGLSKSDLSEEEERIEVEVKKEEVVEANEGLNRGHSRDSCGTTGCEIQAEDFIPQANESDQQNLITSSQLKLIQECVLKDEAGGSIRFKDLLWKSHRTIVIFIRFFWCALCQTYVHQLSQTFFHGSEAAEKLELSLTRIVLIGTGDWRMIKAYREMLKCPFEIYVDSSSKKSLFKQVGLQRTFKSGKSEEKGEYLRDVNLSKIITQSILNIKKMPFRNPGLFTQLGGEFCFELDSKLDPSNLISSSASIRIKKKRFSHLSLRPKPKLQIDHSISSDSHYQKTHDLMDPLVRCVYANRMTNSRDHGSLQKLFDSLGLRILD